MQRDSLDYFRCIRTLVNKRLFTDDLVNCESEFVDKIRFEIYSNAL